MVLTDEEKAWIAGMFNATNDRLNAIDHRLESLGPGLDAIDHRLEAVHTRLDAIDRRLDAVDARLDAIDRRLDAVDARLVRSIVAWTPLTPVSMGWTTTYCDSVRKSSADSMSSTSVWISSQVLSAGSMCGSRPSIGQSSNLGY